MPRKPFLDTQCPHTVDCKYCGTGTTNTGTGLCHSCWEVSHRLEDFMANQEGLIFVVETLAKTFKRG